MTTGAMAASTAERLLAAKQGLIDGDGLKTRGDGAGRIQAALLMDQAVETALKAVLSHHGAHGGGFLSFQKLAKKTATWVPAGAGFLPHREVRNAAQHEGVAPTVPQLGALSAAAEECLREAVTACGADYSRITMEPFVENPATRAALARAGAAHASIGERIQHAHRALLWVRHMAKHVFASARGIETWERFDPESAFRTITANADDRGELTATLLDGLVTAGLGFSLVDELQVATLVRDAGVRTSTEDLHWLVEYTSRHAYRLEQAIPVTRTLSPEETGPTARMAQWLPVTVLPNDS
ncbi:MAG: hypothetical protein VYE22_28500 [Myxococcota bacterium]|nr:hypothetical protein [Myxococcota bacterium]